MERKWNRKLLAKEKRGRKPYLESLDFRNFSCPHMPLRDFDQVGGNHSCYSYEI